MLHPTFFSFRIPLKQLPFKKLKASDTKARTFTFSMDNAIFLWNYHEAVGSSVYLMNLLDESDASSRTNHLMNADSAEGTDRRWDRSCASLMRPSFSNAVPGFNTNECLLVFLFVMGVLSIGFKYSAHLLYLDPNINIIRLDLTLVIVTSA